MKFVVEGRIAVLATCVTAGYVACSWRWNGVLVTSVTAGCVTSSRRRKGVLATSSYMCNCRMCNEQSEAEGRIGYTCVTVGCVMLGPH